MAEKSAYSVTAGGSEVMIYLNVHGIEKEETFIIQLLILLEKFVNIKLHYKNLMFLIGIMLICM